jgi:hypothetical protein
MSTNSNSDSESKKEEIIDRVKININELFDRQPDLFTPTSDEESSETNVVASYKKFIKKKNNFNKSKIVYPEIFTGKKTNEPINKADIQNGIVELYDKITESIYYSKMAFYQTEKNKKLLCDILDELKNKKPNKDTEKIKQKVKKNKKPRAKKSS